MTAHVFIVDERTFPLHLRYQFAGTGALKNSHIDFNGEADTNLHPSTERMLVNMVADISRIRDGDRVIFYLQKKGREDGQFYGIFRAKGIAFIDNDDNQQFLRPDLGKSLTFRVLIEPEDIYPKGVTEWHALDEIQHLNAPYQMLWSLIYRKLKGHRGCTMITPYEEEMLCRLIHEKNQEHTLSCGGQSLDFDGETWEVSASGRKASDFPYTGGREDISIFPRIKEKNDHGQSFEPHLQAHITKTFGTTEDSLAQILLKNAEVEWLGNEVSCGVGMQRIDIMISYTDTDSGMRHIMPIELKAVEASEGNIHQIQRYVDWIQQYYIPNHHSIISPVLLAKGNPPPSLMSPIRQFNHENAGGICEPLRVITFSVSDNRINYNETDIT